MKILDNITYIYPRTPDPEVELKARGLAHEISEKHWPSFNHAPEGIALLYQTKNRYLEVILRHEGTVIFEGSDTQDSCLVEGRSPLHHDFSFLGTWLDNADET